MFRKKRKMDKKEPGARHTLQRRLHPSQAVVERAFNSSIPEVEAGRSLGVGGQPG
ncbi:hypothetical protein LEMLEM_LOCUS23913 [Lemmus lemmus]